MLLDSMRNRVEEAFRYDLSDRMHGAAVVHSDDEQMHLQPNYLDSIEIQPTLGFGTT